MEYLRAILGITIFVGVAWLLSKNRKAIDKKLVLTGIVLQLIIGVLVLKVSWFADIFKSIGVGFTIFISYTREGTQFLFGKLGLITEPIGFVFAFQVLPIIVFFSAVTAGLYYLGILQKVVYAIAWVMSKTMRLSGAESLSAAGNIFLGQTEAPLLVKPFVANMTKSELNCLMTGGMATLAGSVMASYISMLGGGNPEVEAQFASYFLTASIMNAPAALVMSKILYPETEEIDTRLQVSKESLGVNIIDAIATGAADGLKLALNVGGMLIAFIAIVALLNGFLGWIGKITDLNFWVATSTNGVFKELSLQYLFGLLGQPVAWLMGTDWDKSLVVGSLIGQKTAINEYIAYDQLAKFKQIEGLLDTKAIVIATFALCGFANFSSIAIQIGGIGGMAPNRQSDISRLGLRALLGGSLATFMSATIAGALIG
ncbi:NupC/NupG family nucleoside CNT transporter [Raineya orbicola]|jgi:CNT family concentrative nucleoside transporter|uniref:Nucleoside permease n=1 Tax=Raineya orbicola TaxID=2016530 RepID=A0A2N3IF21_9BACT|nr:nucleoside transporter C-terminal domain-containing protein [Raineya orbicola]PKQ68906.1 Nucleoside permease [Raineya orbicola]